MKLYEGNNAQFYGTQADAKAAVGKGNFTEVDVPTDKYGLMSFLNQRANAYDDLRPVEQTERLPAPPVSTQPSPIVERVDTTIAEDEIANADFPTALRLAEHATARVGEHLKAIADERFPKPAKGYAKPDLKGLLS